jgi:hypothetical protein
LLEADALESDARFQGIVQAEVRGTLVLGTRVWTAEEDDLARTLPPEETPRRTGRRLTAVYDRRRVLGVSRR